MVNVATLFQFKKVVIIANIYFSTSDRKTVIELPILPEEMPDLSRTADNEEFKTFNNGNFNLPGTMGLISFSLDNFLPAYADKYSWAKSQINPYTLINFWASNMSKKTPIRIITNRGDIKGLPSESLNLLILVESMNWHDKRNGDVKYTINFKEYRVFK